MEKNQSFQEMSSRERLIEINNFIIVRPGGNDTALVPGIGYTQSERRAINNAVMEGYETVEQVGFVDISNPKNPTLVMAGGEFCGNATRSTAYLALDGKLGETTVSVLVSGKKIDLKAGIDKQGYAWAEMPIKPGLPLYTTRGKGGEFKVVELEGITQVVTIKSPGLSGKASIKKRAEEILRDLDLLEDKDIEAAGVMFLEKQGDAYRLDPVVWVRNLTFFYETACASGTCAVGVIEAVSEGSFTNKPVIQPSGEPIFVSTKLKPSGELETVTIRGPVKVLTQDATITASVEDEKSLVSVTKVATPEQLEKALDDGLIELYQDIFAEPPYEEKFTNQEVTDVFRDYLNGNGLIFLAYAEGRLVAFSAATPLENSNISQIGKANRLPLDSWYIADVGVIKQRRRQKVATQLIKACLELIPDGLFVITRTAKANFASQTLFRGLGLENQQFTQTVWQVREGGELLSDERIFLAKINQ